MGPSVDRLRAFGGRIAEIQAAELTRSGLSDAWREAARARALQTAHGPAELRTLGTMVADHNAAGAARMRNRAQVRNALLAPPAARPWPKIGAWALGSAAAVAALVVAVIGLSAPPPLTAEIAGQAQPEGAWLGQDKTERVLSFSAGSEVVAGADARFRIVGLRGDGADVQLRSGAVNVHVLPRADQRWMVQAGPFEVAVLGTKFDVSWDAEARQFKLALERGKVRIDGPLLEGRILRAGQQLTVSTRQERVVQEPLRPEAKAVAAADVAPITDEPVAKEAAVDAPAAKEAAVDASAAKEGAVDAPAAKEAVVAAPVRAAAPEPTAEATSRVVAKAKSRRARRARRARPATRAARRVVNRPPAAKATPPWALAASGRWQEAVQAADAMGWPEVAANASARQLLAVADAGRLTGALAKATGAYSQLRTRHPGTSHAAQAAFALGRIALFQGRDESAATWFQRYAHEAPSGRLVEQALGRALAIRVRLPGKRGACGVARNYLGLAAAGPRAALARETDRRCAAPAP